MLKKVIAFEIVDVSVRDVSVHSMILEGVASVNALYQFDSIRLKNDNLLREIKRNKIENESYSTLLLLLLF